MKKLAGMALGLSLLMPTLHYEARLFADAARAISGDATTAMPTLDVKPPLDLTHALDKLNDVLHGA